jgi:DNA (cytosine-5)-methyltransferase 1
MEEDLHNSIHTKMNAISLFAGAGGDSLGLQNAGLNVVAFSENNKDAIKTHLDMFPDSKWLGESVKGDITKIPDSEFEEYTGKIKLVFAGFPCQGFSNAGKKDINDPRNKMFYEFLRVVRIVQPEWIIGENVAGLLTKKTDDGESSVIDVIQKEFSEVGYDIVYKVFDVSKVGVPQSRKRLIIVGNRMKIPFVMPDFNYPKQPVGSIVEYSLEGAIECELSPPEHCIVDLKDPIAITGTPHPYLVKKLNEGLISFGKRDSPHHAEVVDLRNPCKTIICAYTFQPRLYMCLRDQSKKLYIRCLTVKELAQVQGSPASHRFSGNTQAAIKQIGNAVPAKLIELITRSMLDASPPPQIVRRKIRK